MRRTRTLFLSMPGLLMVLGALAIVLWTWRPITRSHDVWWHLATGRWMAEHLSITRVDPFSWTCAGAPWANHSWIYDLASYGLFSLLGLAGVQTLAAIQLLVAFAFLVARLRQSDVPLIGQAATVVAVFVAGRYGWVPRPDLTSVACLSALLWLMERYAAAPERTAFSCVPFAVLFAIWANGHAGFFMGFALLGLFMFGRWWRERRVAPEDLLVLAGAAAATLCNPYGWGLHASLLKALQTLPLALFTEWVATPHDWLEPYWLGLVLFWLYWGYRLRARRPMSLAQTLIAGLMTVESVRHVRNVPYFGLAVFPWLAEVFRETRVQSWLVQARTAVLERSLVAAAAGVCLAALPAVRGGFAKNVYPEAACRFIEANGLTQARLFNDYGFGGYLIWALYGRCPVFIDGRYHMIDGYPELFDRIEQARGTPQRWNAFLKDKGVTAAMVGYPKSRPDQSLFRAYFPRDTWALVHWDDTGLLFLRRGAGFDAVIARQEFRDIDPDAGPAYLAQAAAIPGARARLMADVRRNAALHPDSRVTRRAAQVLGISTDKASAPL